jgi:light-regulated signal transduction histidine kinase (bacteriophytochrome)
VTGTRTGTPPGTLLSSGTPIDLTNCEREPIHIPGSVQPHGVLLTVAGAAEPVLQVSGGSERLVGAGHGLVAAGAMAQVRNALRAYAVEDPEPAAVLDRLDHLVSDISLARLAGHLVDGETSEVDPRTALQRLVEVGRPEGSDDDATLLLARRAR